MKESPFTGTGSLFRFILRRDRIRLLLWLVSISFCVVLFATSFVETLPTEADRVARAEFIQLPANVALTGPGHGIDNYTYGAMVANELGFLAAVAIALMSIFLVIRHTRAEEESGRGELIRAAVVGRYAPLTATMITAVAANLVLGLTIALGLKTSMGLSATGSFTFGGWLALLGIVFAALAAVVVQLTEHSRGAKGLAGIAVAIAFILRAAGDIGDGSLSWFSPFGWGQATRPFVDERWWPLLISLGIVILLTAAAYYLCSQRDVGAGMLKPKPGRAEASALLSTPVGLAFRLQRGSLIAWAISLFLCGILLGALGQESTTFIADNPQLEEFYAQAGGGDLVDGTYVVMLRLLAIIIAAFGAKIMLQLKNEENSGRAETVLGTAISRWRYAGSYLTVALAGSLAALTLVGLSVGITVAATSGNPAEVIRLLGAALVNTAAVWLVIALAATIIGYIPRLSGLVWAIIAYGFVSELIGPLLQLPDWTNKFSPFYHIPKLPAADLAISPLLIMTTMAAGLAVLGLTGYRRRDIGV